MAPIAFTALVLLMLLPAGAQLGKYIRTKGFKFVEYYEPLPGLKAQTNAVRNILTGAEGEYLSNGLVRITVSRLENYPPHEGSTNLIALSPESFLDLGTKQVRSTGALHLAANDGRVTLRGWSGYQFSMTNSQLFVSNRVRGFIDGSLLSTPHP